MTKGIAKQDKVNGIFDSREGALGYIVPWGKNLLLIGLIITLLSLVGCNGTTETTDTEYSSKGDTNAEIVIVNQENSGDVDSSNAQPERKMDVYGKIISNEGNEFTILEVDTSKDPTFGMDSEDKKAYMMSMPQEQRMALKDEIRNATLGNVKVMIPVGIPVLVKKEQGPEGKEEMGSLVDMTIGSYISIWYSPEVKDRKVAEYVKKSFTK